MKVSIITAVYNGEKHLEETILSVLNQTYDNVELIVIDGGSTDGTLDIIRNYEDKIAYWVSEPDNGIADAFNKGVLAATGDYINFQGDGDGFCSTDSLKEVMDGVDPSTDQLVSSRIQRIDVDGAELYTSAFTPKFNKRSLLFRMSLPHQGLFTSKEYFKRYGLFDVDNTFCMDYEHLLRAYKNFPEVVMKDVVCSNWRADGLGNGKELEIFKEYDKIKRDNKVAPMPVLAMIKYWTLLKYKVKSYLATKDVNA